LLRIKTKRLSFEDHRVAKKILFMTYITLLGEGTERESDNKPLYNVETSGVITTKLPRECTGHLNFLVHSSDGDFKGLGAFVR
jgi:hypothetical protein